MTILRTNDNRIKILAIMQDFLQQMDRQPALRRLSLTASFEKDLGLGSLERLELLRRIEKAFAVSITPEIAAKVDSLEEVLKELEQLKPQLIKNKFTNVEPLSLINLHLENTKTLVEVLLAYGEHEAERPHIYLQNNIGDEEIITYRRLQDQARLYAKGLQDLGVSARDTVAIMLPTCAEFFYLFFAILFLGAIPVPIYPPIRADRLEEYVTREITILKNAEVRLLITFSKAHLLSNLLKPFIPSLIAVKTPDQLRGPNILPINNIYTALTEDAALIQYTSGSTSDPKGVLLTHANLLANIRAFGEAMQVTSQDVTVSWLPLYHDMGLIGSWLGSLYHGLPVTIMSPIIFLTRPERWLWAIHYHRGTISAAPNFAYELCIKKIADSDIQGLDLSSWRLALNGAEIIYADTIKRFAKRFAPYGFSYDKFYPVYGLAESSVALILPPLNQAPIVDCISRDDYEKEQKATPIKSQKEAALEFVCVGVPIPNHAARIVNDKNELLPERYLGQLQFQGPSVMQGYYRNYAATEAVYHDGWWDSGDIAYQADGMFYIAGREKDIIIKAGRNIHPGMIEEYVNTLPGIRKGCVVAFGIPESRTATEKIIIVAEASWKDEADKHQLEEKIQTEVASQLDVMIDQVIIAPPHTVPKTSSGKLRRAACKQSFLEGTLITSKRSALKQIVFLIFRSSFAKANNFFKLFIRLLYSLCFAVIVGVLYIISLFALMLLPKRRIPDFIQKVARGIFRIMGIPLHIKNSEALLVTQPMIYTANHTSYLDALLFLAILPPNTAFVVKSEITGNIFFKPFVKHLNFITVERVDMLKSLSDMQIIAETLHQGRSILIFPEGTFNRAAGLRPFRLGAFELSVNVNVPICPIATQGMRNLLRSGAKLLNPGAVIITVANPLYPQAQGWPEVMRLSIETRQLIAKYCGEAVLDIISTMPQHS